MATKTGPVKAEWYAEWPPALQARWDHKMYNLPALTDEQLVDELIEWSADQWDGWDQWLAERYVPILADELKRRLAERRG